jgi:hypothetical protein
LFQGGCIRWTLQSAFHQLICSNGVASAGGLGGELEQSGSLYSQLD